MTNWRNLTPTEKRQAVIDAWRPNTLIRDMLPDGATKGSVIGVYNRNPDLRDSHPLITTWVNRNPRTGDAAKPRKPKPIQVVAPTDPQLYDAASMRLSLLELTNRTCKYPTHGPDETGLTFFCGHVSELEQAYCEHHRMRCTGKGTESERSALRSLRKILMK